ncbi:hypothetical protein ACJJTC_004138 [Scirpophaga incertulas]
MQAFQTYKHPLGANLLRHPFQVRKIPVEGDARFEVKGHHRHPPYSKSDSHDYDVVCCEFWVLFNLQAGVENNHRCLDSTFFLCGPLVGSGGSNVPQLPRIIGVWFLYQGQCCSSFPCFDV